MKIERKETDGSQYIRGGLQDWEPDDPPPWLAGVAVVTFGLVVYVILKTPVVIVEVLLDALGC